MYDAAASAIGCLFAQQRTILIVKDRPLKGRVQVDHDVHPRGEEEEKEEEGEHVLAYETRIEETRARPLDPACVVVAVQRRASERKSGLKRNSE